jgi:hypothetical protein
MGKHDDQLQFLIQAARESIEADYTRLKGRSNCRGQVELFTLQ